MAYFKINNNDYSMYVNKLHVSTEHVYKSQANAAGDLTVRYLTTKRVIQVGIIPLDATAMRQLLADVNEFDVLVSYLNPATGELEENVACIIPDNAVDYYTIQSANKVQFKAFTLEFTEK